MPPLPSPSLPPLNNQDPHPLPLPGSQSDPTATPTEAGVKQLWIVYDKSGSMGGYVHSIDQALTDMINRHNHHWDIHLVAFSEHAAYGRMPSDLPRMGRGTNIVAGFKELLRRIRAQQGKEETYKETVVLFISDGADTEDPTTVNDRLARLGGSVWEPSLGLCSLFTLAVGYGFPTGMVVDCLRPCYHKTSEDLPFVFAVDTAADVASAMEDVETHVFHIEHVPEEQEVYRVPLDAETATLGDLLREATRVKRRTELACVRERDPTKALALLDAAKIAADHLQHVLRLIEQRETDAAAVDGGVRKPITSNQLKRTHVAPCRGAIMELRQRVNDLRDRAVKGQLLSQMTDKEKQLALRYQDYQGKHLVKASELRSADFKRVVQELQGYLAAYTAGDAETDAYPEDYIINQGEALRDAQECVSDLVALTGGIADLVGTLPLVGRLVHLKTVDGTQINPYLFEVVDMPRVMKLMNTVDFYTLHESQYIDPYNQEAGNCLVPLTRNPRSILTTAVGNAYVSYMLCKSPDVMHNDALLALIAGVATHLLMQPDTEWADDELEALYQTFEAACPRQLDRYLKLVASPDDALARLALVTATPPGHVPAESKCEHLTKYVFATYVAKRRGMLGFLDAAGLRARMLSLLAEAAGRAQNVPVTDLATHPVVRGRAVPKMGVEELLAGVPFEMTSPFPHAVAMAFEERARGCVTIETPGTEVSINEIDDLGISFFGFTEASVLQAFRKLAGPGVAMPALTMQERVDMLHHVTKHSSGSLQRALEPVLGPYLGLASDLTVRHVAMVHSAARAYADERIEEHSRAVHGGVPITFPRTYTERFRLETGVDLCAVYKVNPETRLSRNACCFRACEQYLIRLDANKPQSKVDKPTSKVEERMARGDKVAGAHPECICNELHQHLAPHSPTPGLHRCVHENVTSDPVEVCELINEGAHLKPNLRGGDAGAIDKRKMKGRVPVTADLVQEMQAAYVEPLQTYEEFAADMRKALGMARTYASRSTQGATA